MSSWQVVKKSFKDFYKDLFFLGAVSLIWFFIVGPLMYVGVAGIFLRQPFPIVMNILFVGPLTLSAFNVTYRLICHQEVKLRDYFQGFAKKFIRGMFAYWLSLVILIILVIDLFFFLNFGNTILLYLSGIWVYLIIYFIMSQFYFWSLLVQTEDKLFVIFKKSLLLVLDNLLYSGGIFAVFLLLTALGVVTAGIAFAVSFIGFLAILSNNATHNLLVKYGIKEELSSPYKIE